MTWLSYVILAVFVVAINGDEMRTFNDHKVLRLTVTEMEDLLFLADQYENNRSLDFWTEPFKLGEVDVHVSDTDEVSFRSELDRRGIEHFVWINNMQELIDHQMRKSEKVPQDFWDQYNSYEDIIDWINTLDESYPDLVTVVSLGSTYQGRDLLAVKVTNKYLPGQKPGLFFNGGIHAREWISPATVTWMLNQILQDYETDPFIKDVLDRMELTVLPVFNADGYAYTWSNDRMWRKTRRPNAGTTCVGTDPNRNFPYQWGGSGTSGNPCTETYHGGSSFSEIEVRTVGEYLVNEGYFKGYIDFHSYSQLWMSPWGYSYNYPEDYNIQNQVSANAVAALRAVYGTNYQFGTIGNTIYLASGNSADYAYAVAGILFAYAPELRDTGSYGFLLPPSQIKPSGIETYEALKVWMDAAL